MTPAESNGAGGAAAPPAFPPARPREIVSWAMFDFANSSYTTAIVTVGFANYFTGLVAKGPDADAWWGKGIAISNLVVVLLSPVVGAIADESGRKKRFLAFFWLLCCLATAGLWFVVPGAILLGLTLFVVSNIAYAFGENLAGAFLPEISTPKNVGRVSGFGWGLGYFGGLACLALVYGKLSGGFVPANVPALREAWVLVAAFFFVAALPTFLFLKERAVPRREPLLAYVKSGFGRVADTVRALRRFRELAVFLCVFAVYSAGLTSIIGFTGIYAERTIGFTAKELVFLFGVLQLSAAGGAFLFGAIQDRIGARRTIDVTLLLWIGVCVAAWAVRSKGGFWGVALGAGLGLGSLQSASRGLVGLFAPPSKSAEFFGFWGLAGKGAAVIGPLVFGLISSASGSQRTAILSTAAFFVLGFLGMFLVNEEKGRAAAAAWREEG